MQGYNNVRNISIQQILSNDYEKVPISNYGTLDDESNIETILSTIQPNKPSINSLQVSNVKVEPEVNCFILTWQNPIDKNFRFVQIRMACNTNIDAVNFSNSEIIYTGNGNSFTYYIDVANQEKYYQFWITTFNGDAIPTERLS